MTDTDIAKIRQSLKKIEKYYYDLNDDLFDELDLIRSLLPCETCNGTKMVFLPESQAEGCLGYSPSAPTPSIPCPDCKS